MVEELENSDYLCGMRRKNQLRRGMREFSRVTVTFYILIGVWVTWVQELHGYMHLSILIEKSESEVSQSCLTLCNPIARQAPSLSMRFSRQEYWSGLPFSSPGDLPDPGIKLRSATLQADSLPSEP